MWIDALGRLVLHTTVIPASCRILLCGDQEKHCKADVWSAPSRRGAVKGKGSRSDLDAEARTGHGRCTEGRAQGLDQHGGRRGSRTFYGIALLLYNEKSQGQRYSLSANIFS